MWLDIQTRFTRNKTMIYKHRKKPTIKWWLGRYELLFFYWFLALNFISTIILNTCRNSQQSIGYYESILEYLSGLVGSYLLWLAFLKTYKFRRALNRHEDDQCPACGQDMPSAIKENPKTRCLECGKNIDDIVYV